HDSIGSQNSLPHRQKIMNTGTILAFDLANPPFNMSDWGGENLRQDVRWKFGMPPVNNANYARIQHFIHHLSPVGVAGFVLANGSMSTQTGGEGDIRKAFQN